MAVDEKIPRSQKTLLDENLVIKMGIKPTKVMCKRFNYGNIKTRIVAEARFSAQTIFNGIQTGNSFLKVFVVRDLSLFYGVDAIAGGKLYTQLSNTNDDDSFTGPVTDISTPASSPKAKKNLANSPNVKKQLETPPIPVAKTNHVIFPIDQA